MLMYEEIVARDVINNEELIKLKIKKRIKKFRHHVGLTQQELADKAGVSLTTIHRYEQNECGKFVPTLSVLILIANVLNIKVEQVFD